MPSGNLAQAGWERDATAAAEVVATGLGFAADAMEYAALGDNDTQAIQLMSSAKMSLKGMVAKVKVRVIQLQGVPFAHELNLSGPLSTQFCLG